MSVASAPIEVVARYESFDDGNRFVLIHQPADPAVRRCTVLYAPPFGDEMNKARRTAALAARAMAERGCTVIQCDLYGCGDSAGEFGDATWQGWIDDLRTVLQRTKAAHDALWLWGLRAGALLLPALLQTWPRANLLLWQPVINGKTHLAQFLRLKTAAAMMGAIAQVNASELRQQLARGESLDVAGYVLSPQMAQAFEAAKFELPPDWKGSVLWLDATDQAAPGLSPASQQTVQRLHDQGINIAADAVIDLPFWQTQEIAEGRALIERSVRGMQLV